MSIFDSVLSVVHDLTGGSSAPTQASPASQASATGQSPAAAPQASSAPPPPSTPSQAPNPATPSQATDAGTSSLAHAVLAMAPQAVDQAPPGAAAPASKLIAPAPTVDASGSGGGASASSDAARFVHDLLVRPDLAQGYADAAQQAQASGSGDAITRWLTGQGYDTDPDHVRAAMQSFQASRLGAWVGSYDTEVTDGQRSVAGPRLTISASGAMTLYGKPVCGVQYADDLATWPAAGNQAEGVVSFARQAGAGASSTIELRGRIRLSNGTTWFDITGSVTTGSDDTTSEASPSDELASAMRYLNYAIIIVSATSLAYGGITWLRAFAQRVRGAGEEAGKVDPEDLRGSTDDTAPDSDAASSESGDDDPPDDEHPSSEAGGDSDDLGELDALAQPDSSDGLGQLDQLEPGPADQPDPTEPAEADDVPFEAEV